MSVWSNFRANFGRIPNGWSPRGNQTRSAYGPRLDAGGSSSGSAVAVSAGFAPLALAAETDGSIIFPANRAALYGIKPTVGLTEAGGGLLSIGGAVPVARSLDSVGVMAKSVWDLTAALGLMAEDLDVPGKMGWGFWDAVETGKRDLWRGMRIGIGSRKVYFDAKTVGSLRIVEACEDAIRRMSDLGAELVEVEMPGLEAVLTYKDEQIITRTVSCFQTSPPTVMAYVNDIQIRHRIQTRRRAIPLDTHRHLPSHPLRRHRIQQAPRSCGNASRLLLSRKLRRGPSHISRFGGVQGRETNRSQKLAREWD